MPDVSIVNQTVTAAPGDYIVPGAADLQPKAVRAAMDGSGAATSWLPALQLLDPAGHVMWTAVDTSSPVAAGGSADVSWFPDVSHSGGATFGASWITIFDTAVSVNSGGGYTSYDFTAGTAYTNDSTTFTIAAGTGLHINSKGWYAQIAQMDWDISAAPAGVAEMRSGIPNISNAMHGTDTFLDYFSGGVEGQATTTLSFGFPVNSTTVGSHGVLFLRQNSGAVATCNLQFSIVRLTSDSGNF